MTKVTDLQVPAPEQGWKATDGSFHASKREALAKNAQILVEGVTAGATDALKKLDDGIAAKEGGEPAVTGESATATAIADAGESSEAAAVVTENAAVDAESAADAGQTAEAGAVEKVEAAGELKKGLYEVSRAADLLQSFAWLQTCVDAQDSTGADALKSALSTIGDWLKAYVGEQIDALFPVEEIEILAMAAKGAPVGELAKFVKSDADLCKVEGAAAFVERLEKATGKADKAHLAAMADHHATMQKSMDGMAKCMKGLGLEDDADADAGKGKKMNKADGLSDEQLAKLDAFDGLAKKFDDVTGVVGALTERLAKVESMPAETKGIINTALVQRNHEGNTGNSPAEVMLQKMINKGASPEETVHAMLNLAMVNPVALAN